MLARGLKRVRRAARKRAVKPPEAQMPEAIAEPTRAEHRDVTLAQAVEEMKIPKLLSKTPEDYQRTWEIEKFHRYKVMDALEARYGYAIDRAWLEQAARIMACPIKRNAPNWQHGRLVYALARHRLAQGGEFVFLDIGSAKGFSAACMALAVALSGHPRLYDIWSVDVIDPCSTEPRNSIRDGKVTRGVWDYCEDFIDADMRPRVHFVQDGDCAHIGFLARDDRIGFAFVDGDHSEHGVRRDIKTIVPRQQTGDIILFDDVQLAAVNAGVTTGLAETAGIYTIERIDLTPSRSYAIAVRQ